MNIKLLRKGLCIRSKKKNVVSTENISLNFLTIGLNTEFLSGKSLTDS